MHKRSSFWRSKSGVAALLIIAVVGYFLLAEHAAHIFPFLPFLFLLLCPLMHLFMHGNHQHGGHASEGDHAPDGEHVQKAEPAQEQKYESFSEQTQQNDAYREGYIEGLKAAREEAQAKEHKHGH